MDPRLEGTIWADLERWWPAPSWTSTIERAAGRLERDRACIPAWASLAMMLGDSGAPGAALIVCLYAERPGGTEADLSRIAAHRNVCLVQLHLTAPGTPMLIPVAKVADPGVVAASRSKLEAWVVRQIAPFDGSLEDAAAFVLQTVLARVLPG